MSDDAVNEPDPRCLCGCGGTPNYGRVFVAGHDKTAEAAFLAIHYNGSVARMLEKHGYGPANPVTRAAVAAGVWIECPRGGCRYVGARSSIRNHLKRHQQEELRD